MKQVKKNGKNKFIFETVIWKLVDFLLWRLEKVIVLL